MASLPSFPDFAARGPYRVGLRELRLPSASGEGSGSEAERVLPTSIWYPATFTPESACDDEQAEHPLGLPHRATPDLPAVDEARPLVVFSHGNSGMRQQSTFLMTHLASWGHVVAAPDHLGNTFFESLEIETEQARREVHLAARRERPLDVLGVLRALLDEAPQAELPPIDPERVGICGHSFGGWTALKLPALEARIRAVCALAPVSEAFVGRKAFGPDELPVPSQIETLVLAARDDVLVDLERGIVPLVDRLGPGARLEVIDGSDHFHFCDGIEMLHKIHENTPREGQYRPTRPLSELLDEDTMHAHVTERVARFFEHALGDRGHAPASSPDRTR